MLHQIGRCPYLSVSKVLRLSTNGSLFLDYQNKVVAGVFFLFNVVFLTPSSSLLVSSSSLQRFYRCLSQCLLPFCGVLPILFIIFLLFSSHFSYLICPLLSIFFVLFFLFFMFFIVLPSSSSQPSLLLLCSYYPIPPPLVSFVSLHKMMQACYNVPSCKHPSPYLTHNLFSKFYYDPKVNTLVP